MANARRTVAPIPPPRRAKRVHERAGHLGKSAPLLGAEAQVQGEVVRVGPDRVPPGRELVLDRRRGLGQLPRLTMKTTNVKRDLDHDSSNGWIEGHGCRRQVGLTDSIQETEQRVRLPYSAAPTGRTDSRPGAGPRDFPLALYKRSSRPGG